ncbi:hypothetical protein [Citreimonas salinaria]|uniref:Phage integrase family protein n=1 Tax=Citreimonas salinaria TaxID=321339 RepID=A0A1H3N820_9RHOB|nr:hypothetical protein [Citreimonas salinaria]SDY84810.1 hypothetical protein SAMN05444340_12122 [Citreimonas salinaria]
MDLMMPRREPQKAPTEGPSIGPALDIEDVFKALLDDIDFSKLAGGLQLTDWDRDRLERGLTLDLILDGFRAARDVELKSKPRTQLQDSGTLSQYSKAVRRLAEADPYGDPYRRFARLTKADDWTSTSARALAKAGLNRSASHAVLELLPALLEQLSADKDGPVTQGLQEWLRSQYNGSTRHGDLRGSDVLELARALNFLHDFPPDLHGRRAQAGFQKAAEQGRKKKSTAKAKRQSKPEQTPDFDGDYRAELEFHAEIERERKAKSRKTGKRPALTHIRKLEAKRRKAGTDCDWRSEIWKQAVADPSLGDDRRAALAVLMGVGCRPAAITAGVHVVHLKGGLDDEHDRIAVRLPGTKLSDFDFLDQDHLTLKRTEADQEDISELRDDPAVQAFNTKGQAWVWYEFDCATPETRWLAKYVRRQKQAGMPRFQDSDPREQEVLKKLGKDAMCHSRIKWPHDFQDRAALQRKSKSELSVLITSAMSGRIKRLARAAFPELKKGGPQVTGYVFRHAWSADLKEALDDPEDVSRAMAHLSSRTGSRYGVRSQAAPRNRAGNLRIYAAEPRIRAANRFSPGPVRM